MKQPVSVSIEADRGTFINYKDGVITSAYCGGNVDHAVLVIGYGTLNGIEYFLVKNSWGEDWGDNGYVKIGTKNDICGITQFMYYPVLY